jgi:hypothetical protein
MWIVKYDLLVQNENSVYFYSSQGMNHQDQISTSILLLLQLNIVYARALRSD